MSRFKDAYFTDTDNERYTDDEFTTWTSEYPREGLRDCGAARTSVSGKAPGLDHANQDNRVHGKPRGDGRRDTGRNGTPPF